MTRLNITGRDAVAGLLREASVDGGLLPWRDPLHEGPVPAGLSLEEMGRMRARFVSGSLDERSFDQVLADYTARDDALKAFKRHDEVVLWFERDLCSQLRLLQVLNWFAQRERGRTRLSLVCSDRLEGDLAALDSRRGEVVTGQLELASRAWGAFCSDRPEGLSKLVAGELPELPGLRAALTRHLEQYPWTRDGLSRSERQVLEAVAAGATRLGDVYRKSQIEPEAHPFLSERVFLFQLREICGGRSNLVQFADGSGLAGVAGPPWDDEIWTRQLRLTEIGTRILSGQADHVRLYGIDRCLGGVRLAGAHAAWRWDGNRKALVEMTG
jgi:hypothetical protein